MSGIVHSIFGSHQSDDGETSNDLTGELSDEDRKGIMKCIFSTSQQTCLGGEDASNEFTADSGEDETYDGIVPSVICSLQQSDKEDDGEASNDCIGDTAGEGKASDDVTETVGVAFGSLRQSTRVKGETSRQLARVMLNKGFKWNKKATWMLIQMRLGMEQTFHDPTCRKQKLWNVIAKKMKEIGGYSVTGTGCDKKWRNVLNTYRLNKVKEMTLGREAITWDFFSEVDAAFGENSQHQDGSNQTVKIEQLEEGQQAAEGKPAEFLLCNWDLSVPSVPEENQDFIWNKKSTWMLIRTRLDMENVFQMPNCKKKKLWSVIAKHMRLFGGFKVTGMNCDQKWRNIMVTYKINKDRQQNFGDAAVTWEFFSELDAVLGKIELKPPRGKRASDKKHSFPVSPEEGKDADSEEEHDSLSLLLPESPEQKDLMKTKLLGEKPPVWLEEYMLAKREQQAKMWDEYKDLELQKLEEINRLTSVVKKSRLK